jgi:hypothetical protein
MYGGLAEIQVLFICSSWEKLLLEKMDRPASTQTTVMLETSQSTSCTARVMWPTSTRGAGRGLLAP